MYSIILNSLVHHERESTVPSEKKSICLKFSVYIVEIYLQTRMDSQVLSSMYDSEERRMHSFILCTLYIKE